MYVYINLSSNLVHHQINIIQIRARSCKHKGKDQLLIRLFSQQFGDLLRERS